MTEPEAVTAAQEPLTLATWCGRTHLHGHHDRCLGWGGREVCPRCGKGDSGEHDWDCLDGKRP